MFGVDGDSYDWSDVALAAALWGKWQALERQVADEGAACRARAVAVDPTAIRARAEKFRHARRLLSADEMNAWLQRWHLTSDQWMDYVRRTEARLAASADSEAAYPRSDPTLLGDAFAALMHAEAVCSGRLEAWASKLAGRAAAHAAATQLIVAPDRNESPDSADLVSNITARGLPPLPPDVCRARTARLAVLERSFQRYRDSVVSPEAIGAEVKARVFEWVRLDCRYVTVPGDDAAREVALTLRRKERPFDAMARQAGVDLHRKSLRVDAVAPDLGAELVSARPGDVIGPLRRDQGFLVLEVLAKTEPSPDDPEVREEAARRVLDRAVRHLVNERVVWHDPL